jgi:hypothetical protein
LSEFARRHFPARIRVTRAAHRSCLERETMANETNMNIPDRPETTPADERIHRVPNEKERAEREANKLAHKGAEREHEFDNLQKPFTK